MIGTRDSTKRIVRGVGGRAFPNDYDWICDVCDYRNRAFETTCQNCDHLARIGCCSDCINRESNGCSCECHK